MHLGAGFQRSCTWINTDVREAVKKGLSAEQIAQQLVKRALKDGSDDNVTCVVVLLKLDVERGGGAGGGGGAGDFWSGLD